MAPHIPLQGGCACGAIRYQLEKAPMFIHSCHCTWCQRETGSAFAINVLVETDNITILPSSTASPTIVHTPSASGRGQPISRCPTCHVALYSHYGSRGPILAFLRAGTLDDGPAAAGEPDVFIFTSTKVPWVALPEGAKVFEEFYDVQKEWSRESLDRLEALQPRVDEWRASQEREN